MDIHDVADVKFSEQLEGLPKADYTFITDDPADLSKARSEAEAQGLTRFDIFKRGGSHYLLGYR